MWQDVGYGIGGFVTVVLSILGIVKLIVKNNHEYKMTKLILDNVKNQDEIDKKDFYDKNDNNQVKVLNDSLKENDKNKGDYKKN